MSKSERKPQKSGSKQRASVPKSRTFIRDQRPYGDPIRDAIASGDRQKMRTLVTYTKRWLKTQEKQNATVKTALRGLEKAIAKLG